MLLVAVALYAAATRIDARAGGAIGPDFWPKAVVGLMALLCVIEIVRRLILGPAAAPTGLATATGDALPDGPDAAPATDGARFATGMFVAGGGCIAAYVLLIGWLGFFLSTLLFLFGFARAGGFRRHGWNLLVATAGSLLTLVLFMRVAYVSLPLGEGPFRALSLALLKWIGVS